MPDREKVLHGLEDEISRAERYDTEWNDCVPVWMLRGAYELLKEQEAKRYIYNYKKYGDYLPHCPSCEKVLPNISQYGFSKFCWACGQAVKRK